MMGDILFQMEDAVFSYRVAGILIHRGRVLLQRSANDSGFAIPGGHAAFGETNAETLRREFQEEMGASVSVGALKWVGECFFPWGNKPCHQIGLYYEVFLEGVPAIPLEGTFVGKEQMENRRFEMEFHWEIGRAHV